MRTARVLIPRSTSQQSSGPGTAPSDFCRNSNRSAIVGSFVLLKICDAIFGLRVTEVDEFDGLDLSQHGESGYNLEDALSATFGGGGGGATLLDDERARALGH